MPQKNNTNSSAGLLASVAITRVLIGFVFFWAFLDKTFGLGFSTPSARAWINGGSPTTGYLSNLDGTFASFFNGLAGNGFVDWLFMLGLFGIGAGLILGIAMRLSIVSGIAMLLLMWLAALPLTTNPIIDDHIVYAAVLVVFWFMPAASHQMSLSKSWHALPFVKKNAWLQ